MARPWGLMRALQIGFSAAAALALIFGVLYSQTVYAQGLRDLEQRLQHMRDQQIRDGLRLDTVEQRLHAVDALDLQRRLTRLETLSEANRTLLLSIAGAVILQVIAASVGLVRSLTRPQR